MSNSPNNAASRILAQQRAMHGNLVACERCDSSHFYEVQITKYLAGGTGSVEILQDTNEQVFPLLKCAGCDFPVLPKAAVGRRAGGIYESAHKEFRESVVKGQDFLRTLDPQVAVTATVNAAAGKHIEGDVAQLKERVLKLESGYLVQPPTEITPINSTENKTVEHKHGKGNKAVANVNDDAR